MDDPHATSNRVRKWECLLLGITTVLVVCAIAVLVVDLWRLL